MTNGPLLNFNSEADISEALARKGEIVDFHAAAREESGFHARQPGQSMRGFKEHALRNRALDDKAGVERHPGFIWFGSCLLSYSFAKRLSSRGKG